MNRLDELRREFDDGFAAPARTETEATTDFLGVRVAGQPFALRVPELAFVSVQRRIVALPSSTPELLGLVGIRSRIVPVYSLARILGLAGARENTPWLATCDAGGEVAFAFESFERYLRLAKNRVRPWERSNLVREQISDGSIEREVIELSQITSGITGRKRE